MSNPVLEIEPETEESTEPYYYGWREVEHQLPDGSYEVERIPLTELDLLHPEEDFVITQVLDHYLNCQYLFTTLREALEAERELDRQRIRDLEAQLQKLQDAQVQPPNPDVKA